MSTTATDSFALTIHLGTDYVAQVKRYSVKLDEGSAPYGEAIVTIVLPAQSTADQINPLSLLRATIVYSKTQVSPTTGTTTRTFDMYLHKRSKDPDAGEMTLTFFTDEAVPIDDMLGGTTVDSSAEAFAPSLRGIINNALSAYSAALMVNFAPNPGVETDLTGWTVRSDGTGNTFTLSRQTGTPHSGRAYFRAAASGTNTSSATLRIGGIFNTTVGTTYSASVWMRSSGTPQVLIGFRTWTGAGGTGTESSSPTISGSFTLSGAWQRLTFTMAAPAGSASMEVSVQIASGQLSAGLGIHADDVTVVASSTPEDFPDADQTITYPLTNMVLNPRAASGVTDWASTVPSGTRTVTNPSTGGPLTNCPSFVRATVNTTVGSGYTVSYDRTNLPYTAGQVVIVSVWVRSSVAQNLSLTVGNVNPAGGEVTTTGPTIVTASANVWHLLTAPIPGGGVFIPFITGTLAPRVIGSGSMGVGATFDVTGWTITVMPADRGSDTISYFDGATSADDYYAYAWTGPVNASTSTRTQLVPRDNDFLRRKPGTRVWDFIQPLVQAAGFRLFCDESRVWRMVNPATYSVAGTITIADGQNITGDVETIDLGAADHDQNNAYATAVVVHYSWISPTTGQAVEAYDAAGAAHGIGFMVEVNGPYPGPGAAAQILARATGRGRLPELAALTDLTATPGMTLVAAQPQSTSLTGVLSSVTWTDNDEMTVTGRNFA